MTLSPDACGVLATVIPVYLLVLFSGSGRLIDFGGARSWASTLGTVAAVLQVAGLTVAEIACVLGLRGGGLTEVWGSVVISAVTTSAGITGFVLVVNLIEDTRKTT